MIATPADFELILNAITDGILVVNCQGIVLYANNSAEQIFERGDLLGKDWAVPLISSAVFQEINVVRRSGIGWAEMRSIPITWEDQPAYVIGVHDITERKKTDSELRIAASTFDSQVGMMIADASSHIIRVNQAFTTITGYTAEEAVGKRTSLLSSGRQGKEFYADMWAAISSSAGKWDGEIWNRRKNGEIYPEHLTITAIKNQAGNITHYVAVLTDSTQHQKMLAQLRTNAADLAIANAQIETERANLVDRVAERTLQLQHANQAKDTFLATMSHEIRTPLGGLLGMMELLDTAMLNIKQRELLHAARESGDSLLRIVNDILDWSKIEAGKLELVARPASIATKLKDVCNTYGHIASAKGIILRSRKDDNLCPAHLFDPMRMSQILNNLTSNAIKFTEHGSVEISAERVALQDGIETVRFNVKDSGIGISKEQQVKLFQQYEQASVDTARMYGGTGLGLAICHRLAKLMGGTLSVNSNLDIGSTFCFTVDLPIANLADQRELQQHIESNNRYKEHSNWLPLLPDGHRKTILVVDDHPINRMLITEQLVQLGLKTAVAACGIVALSLWQKLHFDLIITDCHMPEMDGYELSRNIRRIEHQEARKRIPIIAWTANVLTEEAARCQAAGMDDILNKPTELADLSAMLSKWLTNSNQLPSTNTLKYAAQQSPATAAVIDFNTLDKYNLNVTAQSEMLQAFNAQNHLDIAALKETLTNNDEQAVAKAAHRIKGASGMVGAKELESISIRIEQAAKQNDLQSARAAAADIDKASARLGAALGQVFAK